MFCFYVSRATRFSCRLGPVASSNLPCKQFVSSLLILPPLPSHKVSVPDGLAAKLMTHQRPASCLPPPSSKNTFIPYRTRAQLAHKLYSISIFPSCLLLPLWGPNTNKPAHCFGAKQWKRLSFLIMNFGTERNTLLASSSR